MTNRPHRYPSDTMPTEPTHRVTDSRVEPPWDEIDDATRPLVRELWSMGFWPAAAAAGRIMCITSPGTLVGQADRLLGVVQRWLRDGTIKGPARVSALYEPAVGKSVLELEVQR